MKPHKQLSETERENFLLLFGTHRQAPSTLPSWLTKTFTYDRGKEKTEHAIFTAATQM